MTGRRSAPAIVKAAGGGGTGTFDIVLSTPDVDRDGEALAVKDWVQPLPDRIMLNADHAMTVGSVIGSGVPTIENGQLRVRGTFASTDQAQQLRQLVVEGHLTGCSVEYFERPGGQRELIGGALVYTPANPAAKVLSAKSADVVDGDDADEPNGIEPEDVAALAVVVLGLIAAGPSDVPTILADVQDRLTAISSADPTAEPADGGTPTDSAEADMVKALSAAARAKALALMLG